MNDTHQYFDELVRKRLEALPNPTPPSGGWSALQRELDEDADMVLRNALTGLAAGTSPTGWEALERKLDPQTTADQQLADRLNGLKPAPPTGWETLVARMDRENDEAIDAIVTDGLARTAPTVTSGWAALAARLELIGWRRSTVAAWKLTEGCLLLSLLLLFVRFGPSTPSNPTFAELAEGFPLPLQAELNSPETKTTNEQKPPQEALVADLTKSPELFTATVNKPQPTASPSQITPRSNANTVVQSVPPLPVSNDVSLLTVSSQPELETAAPSSREDVYLPENVATLAIDELNTRLYPPSPALILPKQDNTEPIYYYLNGFVSPIYLNQVITPATEILEIDITGGRRITYGKSAGLMLDVMHGKNGLQFGFIYNRRSYIPTALKYWQEDEHVPTALAYDGGYNRFVFDALEIQFNYKRTILETEKWRLSGKIGMGINLVAYADFDDQERFVSEFNDFHEWVYSQSTQTAQPFAPPEGARSGPGDTQEGDQLTEPAAGFLEGGGVFDNSSLYFNGGIVVERLINQRWSVYVAPSFGRALFLRKDEGIGPYKDRINPAGLRFGSRYHFGGK